MGCPFFAYFLMGGIIMGITNARLTVFFEDPFYIALYERTQDGYTQVCRVVFGKEPTDAEIYEYFLENWPRLKFSPPVPAGTVLDIRKNPKRIQREIHRQLSGKMAAGTKSQQALKLQQEQAKAARRAGQKQRRALEEQQRFELRRQKKKEKHKGR